MLKLYRLAIIGILTFTLVSACGVNSVQQETAQADESRSGNVRVVEHALGKTQVPTNPQRVVVVSNPDTVLSLGVTPVGSMQVDVEDFYLKSQLEEIESTGAPNVPNLESIVALNPDLILGTTSEQKVYDQLSQIAPTVLADVDSSADWKNLLYKYAEALGKTDEAEQVMVDYNARIEKFQAQMGDRLQETTVSIVRLYQGIFNIYLEDSFSGTIVADVGLPRPPKQINTGQTFNMDISKEELYMADGDVMFVWTSSGSEEIAADNRKALEELKADPLWSRLSAVQQGQVYDVPSYWIGMGPIAANLVLDDLFEHLVDSPSQASQ